MTKHDMPTTISCPLEHTTVDAERCAARGSDRATCTGEDRLTLKDPSFLLLAL